MSRPHPLLYQINTRVYLTELGERLGRTTTLDDIPDSELDRLVSLGFNWVWLLSVWQTGLVGQRISRGNAEWRKEFQATLLDLKEDDIAGSGFAITDYKVSAAMGGNEALSRLRQRLHERGLQLLLDFVPNHTAIDHRWVGEHPEYFMTGTEADLLSSPNNYVRLADSGRIMAYGRDPYFSGWPDTLQLDYSNPATQKAMTGELLKIAGLCDGVRCDMAMLLLPEVFHRTWGREAQPFWSEAIGTVRHAFPTFCFMAEVYWDLEWALLQQGFDYAYDKRLYDRLREGQAGPVRDHLQASLQYQSKMARFLENHDEPRAAVVFPTDMHEAAAAIAFLTPGLRFFHQGQLEGKRKKISPHLIRGPREPKDEHLERFYGDLLKVLRQAVVHEGHWQLLECTRAWADNWTSDCFICFMWHSADSNLLVVANYSDHQSQCYVRLPLAEPAGQWRLRDGLSDTVYDRDGADLAARGLYLDLPPWGAHAFEFGKLATNHRGNAQESLL